MRIATSSSLLWMGALLLLMQPTLILAGRRRKKNKGNQKGVDNLAKSPRSTAGGGGRDAFNKQGRRTSTTSNRKSTTTSLSRGFNERSDLTDQSNLRSSTDDHQSANDLFMPLDVPEPEDPAVREVPAFSTGRFKNHQRKTILEQARHLQPTLIKQMEAAHSDPDAGEWLIEDELCGGKGCTDPQGAANLRGSDNSVVYSSTMEWSAAHLDETACCLTRYEFYVKHTHLFTRCTECDDNGKMVDRGDDWKAGAQHKGSSQYGNGEDRENTGEGGTATQQQSSEHLTERNNEETNNGRNTQEMNNGINKERNSEEINTGRSRAEANNDQMGRNNMDQRRNDNNDRSRGFNEDGRMSGAFDRSADRQSSSKLGGKAPEGSSGVSNTEDDDTKNNIRGNTEGEGSPSRVSNIDNVAEKQGEVNKLPTGPFDVSADKQEQKGSELAAGKKGRMSGAFDRSANRLGKGKKKKQKQEKQGGVEPKQTGGKKGKKGTKSGLTREEEKKIKQEKSGRQKANPNSKRQQKKAARKEAKNAAKKQKGNKKEKGGKKKEKGGKKKEKGGKKNNK